ncbi:MAG: M56 family metallopeptidase [bacterium]|nr:M56 family metallopeptidase [bacterium]
MSYLADIWPTLWGDVTNPTFHLEVILKTTVVFACAFVILRTAQRASAAGRHLVLGLALATSMALPLFTVLAPLCPGPSLVLFESQWQIDLPLLSGALVDSAAGPFIGRPAIVDSPLRVPWIALLNGFWFVGAVLVCARLSAGLGVVVRILAVARPVSEKHCVDLIRESRRQLGVKQTVSVVISHRAVVPFTWGCLRPKIILPTDALQWSAQKLRIVLLHELAHIQRWDTVSTGIAYLAAIVYWFNPLVWWTRRQMLLERERASDDRVINAGIRASDYAGVLLEIARTARTRRWLPELQVAMAQRTTVEERIMSIVSGSGQRACVPANKQVIWLGVALLMILPLAGMQIFANETVGVEAAQMETINTLLDDFHKALNRGDDYDAIAQRFLVADYFQDPAVTFETWPPNRRDRVMRSTLNMIRADSPAALTYNVRMAECRMEGRHYVVSRKIDIGKVGPAGKRRAVASDLTQTIVLAEQDGRLKIRKYEGGIGLLRMDVNTSAGPILALLVDDSSSIEPVGPLLLKSIPRSIVPDNDNLIPLRTPQSK